MKRAYARCLVTVLVLVVLTACAAGPNELAVAGPGTAGFWRGLWHGLISPITFVISLFTRHVNVYEVHNNGNWYDAGFMLGVAMAFGSGGGGVHASGRRSRRRSRDLR